eukprot:1142640-Pelagomonas_calceolata.AAC.13
MPAPECQCQRSSMTAPAYQQQTPYTACQQQRRTNKGAPGPAGMCGIDDHLQFLKKPGSEFKGPALTVGSSANARWLSPTPGMAQSTGSKKIKSASNGPNALLFVLEPGHKAEAAYPLRFQCILQFPLSAAAPSFSASGNQPPPTYIAL